MFQGDPRTPNPFPLFPRVCLIERREPGRAEDVFAQRRMIIKGDTREFLEVKHDPEELPSFKSRYHLHQINQSEMSDQLRLFCQ